MRPRHAAMLALALASTLAPKAIAQEPEISNAPKDKIRTMFKKGLDMNYIGHVKPDMLKIENTEAGYTMTVDYERRENLIANLDVVGVFHAEQALARGGGQ